MATLGCAREVDKTRNICLKRLEQKVSLVEPSVILLVSALMGEAVAVGLLSGVKLAQPLAWGWLPVLGAFKS